MAIFRRTWEWSVIKTVKPKYRLAEELQEASNKGLIAIVKKTIVFSTPQTGNPYWPFTRESTKRLDLVAINSVKARR